MQSVTSKPETLDQAIHESADPVSVEANVQAAVTEHRRLRVAYQGGLAAERQSWRQRRRETRSAIRAAYLAGLGRPIDLIALLRQRDSQGAPVWTVADPIHGIGRVNGRVHGDGDGDVAIATGKRMPRVAPKSTLVKTGRPCAGGEDYQPAGLPALPPEARSIVTDEKIRRRAEWVGVLYQPETWHQVDPDPAVVVEWRDRPGEYYCLAVWGGTRNDRGQIEEFID